MSAEGAGPADPRRDRESVAARVEGLYARHSAMVLAVCRGLLRDEVEAEDAAQQTFLSAQRALANGSAPREPAPWLATIARNECLARLRARASGPLSTDGEPEDAASGTHAAAVSREQVAELRDALAELPEQQREAILLREVRGLSYAEVAALLAVTTPAVESLIFRARRRLRVSLRGAVTAVSPVGWIVPVRELAARLAGGGVANPDVVKAVAVGVGTAAVASVSLSPQLVGLGHAPAHARAPHVAAHPHARAPAQPAVAAAPAGAPPSPSPARQLAAAPGRGREDVADASLVWSPSGGGDGSRAVRRAGRGGSGGETETETTAAAGTSTAGQSRREREDGSSSQTGRSSTEREQSHESPDPAPTGGD